MYRHSRLDWHDPFFLALAFAIVYPDWVLDKMHELTGRNFNIAHLLGLQALALLAMVCIAALLIPANPKLQWWHLPVYIGVVAGVRAIHRLIMSLFDF